ncbi:hypothetical protein KAFR_0C00850 [Kazachstania africana CBS 2517]|uniref:Thioredoxin domain-containing protein n=1 Tax=Kazachstania africana (strain ATCC 22294 / BCRC 22015 / CBS 2517 / CECT 1963 / NBRC 1671 / NRRL Y-8276) TaxID=1071382 RepID=H2ART0_KAZAF|nr:hypothetical protein KAFR_0C00850 [Kazachstania africana CBS 2517]CCF57080.1 hypothetical protein KAFR_0C00850 [Kazachstania africana CBS 2517]
MINVRSSFVRPRMIDQEIMKLSLVQSQRLFTSSPARKSTKPLSRKPIGGNDDNNLRSANLEFSSGKAIILCVLVGGIGYYIFQNEKHKMDLKREQESKKGYGKPQIGGGRFTLIDHNGNPFSEQNLLGKFSLIYFGFSHCPDICPDELDLLGVWLDKLKKDNIEVQPVFITCDPARDKPEVLKEYLSDFHDGIIGVTGEYDDIKNICKQYRVYFSTPQNVRPDQDYLVDHSIFFYLMDPQGQFMEALGRNHDENSGVIRIKDQIRQYKEADNNDNKKWF